jgi:beta-glucosidase/6-phospho-beta-glucosidase/beta-galactosidase
VFGWYKITHEYFARYKKPVMYTETNVFDPQSPGMALETVDEHLADAKRRRAGLGFTWYSLTDQVDWNIGLARKEGTVNPCGLFDLERRPRPSPTPTAPS